MVLAAMAVALMALASAPSASATVLEVGGATKNEPVEIAASLEPGTSALIKGKTEGGSGEVVNTCTESHIKVATVSPFVGSKVSGPVSEFSFSGCAQKAAEVHQPGKFYIEHISSTTNGTVSSENAEVTMPSPFGTPNCKTSTGVDIGTLTGKKKATRHWTRQRRAELRLPGALRDVERRLRDHKPLRAGGDGVSGWS